jgi:CheY-like chemotaxis protein
MIAAGSQLLIVDDDDVEIMAVKRALRGSPIDWPIRIARDGVEALAILRGEGVAPIHRPYVILLDLNMPRMNGIEFLRELRADPDHRDAVVFVLTTSDADQDRVAANSQQVAGYVVKRTVGGDFVDVADLLNSHAVARNES